MGTRLGPSCGAELLRRLAAGEVTLLDVRPPDEYHAGHIPGAVSMPVDEVERRLAEIPRDRPIIAYCRGRYCVFAREAVEILRRRGFEVREMEEGIPEWRLAGYAVATGDPAG